MLCLGLTFSRLTVSFRVWVRVKVQHRGTSMPGNINPVGTYQHRRTGEHPFGGVKPSFARMANTTCLSHGPAREKK